MTKYAKKHKSYYTLKTSVVFWDFATTNHNFHLLQNFLPKNIFLVRSMTFIGSWNQFFAVANLILTQQLLKKIETTECIFTLYHGHLEYEQIECAYKAVTK